jgi:hypothetical protein
MNAERENHQRWKDKIVTQIKPPKEYWIEVLRPDGQNEDVVLPARPKDLQLYYDLIGTNMVERVECMHPARRGLWMIVDEDGLIKRSKINLLASNYAGRPIVGVAIVLHGFDL